MKLRQQTGWVFFTGTTVVLVSAPRPGRQSRGGTSAIARKSGS